MRQQLVYPAVGARLAPPAFDFSDALSGPGTGLMIEPGFKIGFNRADSAATTHRLQPLRSCFPAEMQR